MSSARPPLSVALACSVLLASFAPSSLRAQTTTPLPLGKGPRHAVKIDSSPQQAAIYVNDKAYGIQGYTPQTLKLPNGDYKLLLELPGWKAREVPITITRAQAFSIALEREARPSILDLRPASDGNALAAQILVDGTSVGTLPNRIEVAAGRHVVEVKKPGFVDYRDDVEVAEGEVRTMVVALVAQVKPGAILVTADVPNAAVYVDGQRRDTAPAVVNDLPEGAHTVEVRVEGPMPSGPPNGLPPQPWKQVVMVVAGQQTKVAAQLTPATPPPPPTGSIKVLSSTPGAEVVLDGDPRGAPNAEIRDVPPGTHYVEVRAQGFVPRRQEVAVTAGELRVVALDLDPQVTKPAVSRLRVISPVPEVEVFVDGASVGRAPVDRDDLSPGKHFVVARKPGYADYQTEVDLEAGKTTEIAALLKNGGSIRAMTNVPGADVYLDGALVGKTPVVLPDVGTGEHLVEFKLPGYVDSRQTVRVDGGTQQVVGADLQMAPSGPPPAELERTTRSACSWCGQTLAPGRFNVDASAGYPYFFDARLIAGAARVGRHFGLDVAVELRTNLFFTDVGIRPRVQIIKLDPFILGADLAFYGGGGPTSRNDFSFEVGPIATLAAGPYVHVNFRPYLQISTDRLCPSVDAIKSDDMQSGATMPGKGSLYTSDTRAACREYVSRADTYLSSVDKQVTLSPFGQPDPRERFVSTRFFLQASIEVAVLPSLNVFALVEGAPGQDQRYTFTSQFNSWFPANDFPLYGRAGVTGKF